MVASNGIPYNIESEMQGETSLNPEVDEHTGGMKRGHDLDDAAEVAARAYEKAAYHAKLLKREAARCRHAARRARSQPPPVAPAPVAVAPPPVTVAPPLVAVAPAPVAQSFCNMCGCIIDNKSKCRICNTITSARSRRSCDAFVPKKPRAFDNLHRLFHWEQVKAKFTLP